MGNGISAKKLVDERRRLEGKRDRLDVSIRAIRAALSPQNCRSRDEATELAQRLAKATRERSVINSQLQQIDAVHTNATMIEGSVMVQRATVTAARRVEDLNRHMVTKAEATRSAAKVAQVVQRLDVSNDAVETLTEAISSAAGEVLESATAAAGGDGGDSPEQKEIDEILAKWEDAQHLDLDAIPMPPVRGPSPVAVDPAAVGHDSLAPLQPQPPPSPQRQDEKK